MTPAEIAPLPAGPAPVTLPALDPTQRRTIAKPKGYLIIDAEGGLQWGHLGKDAPFQRHPMKRGERAFAHVIEGELAASFPDGTFYDMGYDSFGKLARDGSVEALVLADAATPARVAMVKGLQAFGIHPVTLAAGDANTTVAYAFATWDDMDPVSDLTLHVDDMAPLAGEHPKRVLLEITDATTTAQLVTALGALSAAGVAQVRIHRLMGWGAIPVSEIIDVKGVSDEDDVITKGERATVEIGEPALDDHVDKKGIASALQGYATRFRYCYEKRGQPKLHGSIEVTFDIAENGDLSNKHAKGLDPKIASCVEGALFDLEIAPGAIHAAGHAKAAIAFNVRPPPEAPEPTDGFWCVAIPAFPTCGRSQDQCELGRTFYVDQMKSHGEVVNVPPCTHQATAWTSDGQELKPTRAQCEGKCRQVR